MATPNKITQDYLHNILRTEGAKVLNSLAPGGEPHAQDTLRVVGAAALLDEVTSGEYATLRLSLLSAFEQDPRMERKALFLPDEWQAQDSSLDISDDILPDQLETRLFWALSTLALSNHLPPTWAALIEYETEGWWSSLVLDPSQHVNAIKRLRDFGSSVLHPLRDINDDLFGPDFGPH